MVNMQAAQPRAPPLLLRDRLGDFHRTTSPTFSHTMVTAYVEDHEEPESINWLEFRATFCAHRVPQGVIKLKKEFQDLKQGSMFVNEYIIKFTQLSRYAPHEVDTNERKQECFLNILNDVLAYALEARDYLVMVLMNNALVLENRKGVMEHKCKLLCQHQLGSRSRLHVAASSVGPVFCPAQPQFQSKPQVAGQGFFILQDQVIQHPNNF
jgi:hypothetical protein